MLVTLMKGVSMRYALVNNQKLEAQPNLLGSCTYCEKPMTSKCGEKNIWHWAHKSKRICDSWWENETEWHRTWKSHFPVEWQEIIQHADDGEKHIADVKTDQDLVLEFQHSQIMPEERLARENFYKKILWIVDGKRRLRDKIKFFDEIEFTSCVDGRDDNRILNVLRSTLLCEWSESNVPVFFDFGEDTLWCLLPKNTAEMRYLFRVDREVLLASLISDLRPNNRLEGLLRNWRGLAAKNEWHHKRNMEERQDPFRFLVRRR